MACVVQDCVPFGAAALLTFDTVTLTPKQGKGIAVPYRFGCLPESTLVAYRETVSFVYKVID